MITISSDTWADLHTDSTSPIAREEIPQMLKHAIEAGIPVWLTNDEGQRIKQVKIEGGQLNIDRSQNS